MQKRIGVTPLWDDEKASIWMLPEYLDSIREAGGLPIIFPLTTDPDELTQLCDLCDGFLLTGGQDVDPAFYNGEPIPELTALCKKRDLMEKQIVEYAVRRSKAVLGICRGLQLLNAALGGTLYQDLPKQHPSDIKHSMTAPYDRACHTVQIVKNSGLYQVLQVETLGVNSRHHQAIKTPAPGLAVMAVSEDGLAEAVCLEHAKFIWAVQWHPEHSHQSDENSRKLFKAFIANC